MKTIGRISLTIICTVATLLVLAAGACTAHVLDQVGSADRRIALAEKQNADATLQLRGLAMRVADLEKGRSAEYQSCLCAGVARKKIIFAECKELTLCDPTAVATCERLYPGFKCRRR